VSASSPATSAPVAQQVVVIGGGIIGVSAARELVLAGHEVTLVDEGVAAGSSAGNAGLLVPSYATPMSTPQNLLAGVSSFGREGSPLTLSAPVRPSTAAWLARFALACRPGRVRRDTARLLELARWSHDAYHRLQDEGLDLGLRRSGWLWTSTAAEPAALRRTASRLRAAGAVCEVVDAEGAHALEPGLAQDVRAGIWFPEESVLDPATATRALFDDARRHGVRWEPARVLGCRRSAGRVQAVRTTRGDVEADHVVIATGADTRAVGRLFGLRVPIEAGYGWSVTLRDDVGVLAHPLLDVERHVVISPLRGQVRITGGMELGGRPGSTPRPQDVQRLQEVGRALVPALGGLEQVAAWRGARPMTASGLPLVEGARGLAGVTVAAGHGPLGMTLAPSTARRVVQQVADDRARRPRSPAAADPPPPRRNDS